MESLKEIGYPHYELSPQGEVFSVERLTSSFKGDRLLHRVRLKPLNGYVWLNNHGGKKKFKVDWLLRHIYDVCPIEGPLTLEGEVWRAVGQYRISSFKRVMNKHKQIIHPDKKGFYTLTIDGKRSKVKKEVLWAY